MNVRGRAEAIADKARQGEGKGRGDERVEGGLGRGGARIRSIFILLTCPSSSVFISAAAPSTHLP